MNLDRIFDIFNQHGAAYLLIGGMNFMLRHQPILTFDVDLWIEDSEDNRARCEQALSALDAEWGETDANWEPVARKKPGWLARQSVFSFHSPHGAIDLFRFVPGLADWRESFQNAAHATTLGGISYVAMPTGARSVGSEAKPHPGLAEQTEGDAVTDSLSELIQLEQAKRERNWPPEQRWKVLQETITWVESQATVRRNTREACLANQQRLLAQFARFQQVKPTGEDRA